jgi:hypothetical protein
MKEAATEAALLFPIVFIEPLLRQIALLVFRALTPRAARKSGWTQDTKVPADSQYDGGQQHRIEVHASSPDGDHPRTNWATALFKDAHRPNFHDRLELPFEHRPDEDSGKGL